jgi:tRNA1Val (adenine37-N6)-methyltransferase
MSNNFFKFKQFTVYQDRCAMKVGTDGTLLGAWTNVQHSKRILDIGTGTGLIALMVAQRSCTSEITAIDIDEDAVSQALYNVSLSPWKERISVICKSLQQLEDGLYDTIVSNPPFFVNSLACPNEQRTLARHTDSLTYSDLFAGVKKHITHDGEFSVIIPAEVRDVVDTEAAFAGMFPSRIYAVRTTPTKKVKRYLLSYRNYISQSIDQDDVCIENQEHQRSVWYQKVTGDYYL